MLQLCCSSVCCICGVLQLWARVCRECVAVGLQLGYSARWYSCSAVVVCCISGHIVSRMCCSRAARSRANSHYNLLRIPANATRCNTLQHPATLCSTLISKWTMKRREFRSYCESQVHQGLDREELNKQYICTARFFENSRVRI